jgi:hypothetical protein
MRFLIVHGWQNRRPPGHWHAAGLPVERVLLVAPPSPDLARDAPVLAGFRLPPGYGDRLAASTRTPVRLVCGDADPYCPRGLTGRSAPAR